MNEFKGAIILSNVNTLLGSMFIASFAFGAGLMIWHAAYGTNPIEKALYIELYQTKQALR